VSTLFRLLGVFGLLSVLAVGGGLAVLPEMKRLTVEQYHWVTADQFVDFYSLGQMAPGPNMVMVTLIGYKVAALAGAIAVLVAFFLPASVLTFGANRLWHRLSAWPWRESIRRGLAPVTVGLMLAGVISIGKVAIDAPGTAVLAVAVTGLLLTTRVNPALLILGSAIVGWTLLR
jgi:chromate transporter